MKARLHARRCLGFGLLFLACAIQTELLAHATIRITEGLSSQTVALGDMVRFGVKIESQSSVAFQWYHEEAPIRNATNSEHVILNSTAEDLGKYLVVVRTSSEAVTNAAVLDFISPYPDIRMEESVVFSNPRYPDPRGDSSVLPSGLIVQFIDGISWRTYRCFEPFQSLRWQSDANAFGTVADGYYADTTFDVSPEGNIRIGVNVSSFPVYGQPVSRETPWVQMEVTEAGKLVYFRTNSGIGHGSFVSNPDGTITAFTTVPPSSSRPQALAFNGNGELINRITAPPGFRMAGAAFYLEPGAPASTRTIPEFNFNAQSTNSGIFGKYSTSLVPQWITEVDVAGRFWNRFMFADSPLDDSIITVLIKPGQTSTNTVYEESLVKIVRGRIAWELPCTFSAPIIGSIEHFWISPLGTIVCAARARGAVTIGSRKVGPFPVNSNFTFTVDQGGVVRQINTVFWASLVRSGPSRYYGLTYPNYPENDSLSRAKFTLPEPDLNEPPAPQQLRTITNGAPVTLSASPDVPGVCVYRWFRNGQELSGERAHDLTIRSFSVADAGEYSVKIRNAYSSVINRIATLSYDGPAQLAAETRPTGITISWPLSAVGYRLQEMSELDSIFMDVQSQTRTNGATGIIEAILPTSSNRRVYRLIKE